MSATIYREPNKLPAGVLALVVHGLFFALLFFGFSWNRQAYLPATLSVDLWKSLPEESVAPPVKPKIEEVVTPPQPEKAAVPDIVIPEKKKPVPIPAEVTKPEIKKPASIAVKAVKPGPDKAKTDAQNREVRRIADEQASQKAEQARLAEQVAAIGRVVDEYQAKIQAKIRRNIVMPPDVANDALAEFMVTLLPGGSVLKAALIKSSGNQAYDSAVERAILKSDPLPLPPDASLFNRFRELDLVFKPAE